MKQESIDPKQDFMEALDILETERGIDKEIIIDTIEQALLTAYKKNYTQHKTEHFFHTDPSRKVIL